MYSETSAPSKKTSRPFTAKLAQLPSSVRTIGLFFAILIAGLAVWQLAVDQGWLMKLVPRPSQVWTAAVDVLGSPFYYTGSNDFGIGFHLLASLERVALGFVLAAIVAVPLGFVIGISETFSKAIDPFVQLLKPVSPLAWLPIGLAVLKSSEGTAIFVIFISSIWPILINTIFGVRSTSGTYLKISRTLEASRWMTIRHVLLPASLPNIVTGLRISLSIAWLVIIAAEMLVGGKGIGYYIWNEWNNLNLSSIIVCIILIGLVGLVLDKLLSAVEKRIKYES
jgi:nitrate/nitrite transport system permease protein